jgi:tyrosyl-tRNA synthetase
MVHGEDEAVKAQTAARALFAGAEESEDIPFTHMEKSRLDSGIDIISILVETGLSFFP